MVAAIQAGGAFLVTRAASFSLRTSVSSESKHPDGLVFHSVVSRGNHTQIQRRGLWQEWWKTQCLLIVLPLDFRVIKPLEGYSGRSVIIIIIDVKPIHFCID